MSEQIVQPRQARQDEESSKPVKPATGPVKRTNGFLNEVQNIKTCQTLFGGKPETFNNVSDKVKTATRIPNSPTLSDLRTCQIRIWNLAQILAVDLAVAENAMRTFDAQKKRALGAADHSKVKSATLLEAKLLSNDTEYQEAYGLHLSAETSFRFLKEMHSTCMTALETLKQIGITITSENKAGMFDGSEPRGQRV